MTFFLRRLPWAVVSAHSWGRGLLPLLRLQRRRGPQHEPPELPHLPRVCQPRVRTRQEGVKIGGVDHREGRSAACGRGTKHRFGRISGPLFSCRGPQPALNCSCRSDRVTRDEPAGLRVGAAQTEAQKQGSGLTGRPPSPCPPRPRALPAARRPRPPATPCGSAPSLAPPWRPLAPPARIVCGRISGPLSSCFGPQAALKSSYRSDRVGYGSPRR